MGDGQSPFTKRPLFELITFIDCVKKKQPSHVSYYYLNVIQSKKEGDF